jgi:excisionase family DNA binding protein
MALEELMILEEAAQYFKVDRFTVYRSLLQQKLPGFRIRNQWRVCVV